MIRRRMMMLQQSKGFNSAYEQLDYVVNNGYCLVPTSLYFMKNHDEAEIDFYVEDTNIVRVIMSGEYGNKNYLCVAFRDSEIMGYFDNSGTFQWAKPLSIQKKYQLRAQGYNIYVDNTLIYTNTKEGAKGNFRLWGAIGNNTAGKVRIYNCKLIIDGIAHSLIPVKRKTDGEIGFLNTTTNEFYINSTTEGELIGGITNAL